MIHIHNMSKWYPTKQGRSYVYKNVDLALPMDKSIGVIGRNGAGKSTLVKMLGGADFPNAGDIQTNLNISWPLGLQGGTQNVMTGRENTRFVARIHGIKNTSEVEERVESFADIGKYFNEPMRSYSSGMRSRVMLGITLAFDFNFDVLLIDELTAVGDAEFKKKATVALKEKFIKTKVIMVNHSVNELKKFCEAGLVVKDCNVYYFENLDDAVGFYQS